MIPLWFTIETPLSPAQVCERIKDVTHPASTSFWNELRLDWSRSSFHGKLFAGRVQSHTSTFRIFNYLWKLGDKTFTVYDGWVESSGARTIVRVTLVPSSMLKIMIAFIPLTFVVLSAFHPETLGTLPGTLLFVAAVLVPLFTILQAINCFKAKKLFIEILTTSQ